MNNEFEYFEHHGPYGEYAVSARPVEPAAPVVAPNWVKDLGWEGIAGAIIDTVHLTNEDYVNEKLVVQLKRYFGGSL